MPAAVKSGSVVSDKLTAGTSFTIPGDSSAVAGDRIVRALSVFGDPTITWPAGWTVFQEDNQGGSATNSNTGSFAYFEATGSVADITVTSDVSAEASYAGCTVEDFDDMESSLNLNASSGAMTIPTLATTWTGETTLWISLCAWGRGSRDVVDSTSYPLTDNQERGDGGSNNNPSCGICSERILDDELSGEVWGLNYNSPHVTVTLGFRDIGAGVGVGVVPVVIYNQMRRR